MNVEEEDEKMDIVLADILMMDCYYDIRM